MNKKCTLVLSSYDEGEDLWEGFFKALKVQWPQMDMQVVLNTETKNYFYPEFDIVAFHVCENEKMPWGKRLIENLKRINTDYILLFLEDYWLDAPVDHSLFMQTIKWMDENPEIANFSFYPTSGLNVRDDRFKLFERRPQKAEYRLNCQVGLWRREKLIEYIRPFEDPWEWEVWGSKRSAKYQELFYSLEKGGPKPFSYGDPNYGCLIHRGKWVEDAARRLCEMYELKIDFSIRGFEEWPDGDPLERDNSFWGGWKRPHRIKRIIRKIHTNIRGLRSIM